MKNFTLFILVFGIFLPKLISQSVCEQFLKTIKNNNPDTLKKRTFRMTSQLKDDPNVNITEADTSGKMYFLENVGSLKIESFYANGKRYSKIQNGFIIDDEWTYQEVEPNNINTNKWFDLFKKKSQDIDCQLIGEEKIRTKKCLIFTYPLHIQMPKRNGVDSFWMNINAKTWFCPNDKLVYKHIYEMTTERLSQTVKSTIEYDVPLKIELPKKAKYEENRKTILSPSVIADSSKRYDNNKSVLTDSTKIKDSTTIFTVVDQTPQYKEGSSALFKYISNNMHFPEDAQKEGLSGTVHISFVVELNGLLSNIQIKKSVRDDVDSEAIRVVQSMSGAWKAGKINGKDVRSTYILPLRFEFRE